VYHAPIRCLEDGQEPPSRIEIEPANAGKPFSGQPDARCCASSPAYILNGENEGSLGLPAQGRDLLGGQP
jgi:hypothetical protein